MREIIIEVPDKFGKTLKPEKVNTEIKGELVRCRIVSIGYPVKSLIKMILSSQGAKETVAGGRLTNFAQMLRGGEVGMKEYIMIKETGNAPITVAELVRCKDCKHHLECDYWIENGDDWFCADGKRKQEKCNGQ